MWLQRIFKFSRNMINIVTIEIDIKIVDIIVAEIKIALLEA